MPTTNDFNIIEEMGKSGDKNYEALIKKQQEIEKLLEKELSNKNRNVHNIRRLQDFLSDINEVVAKQNDVLKDFHDEFVKRVGEGKDFDAQMLTDLMEFQTAQVEASKAISERWKILDDRRQELIDLRKQFREGGKANGQIVAGLTPEEEKAFKEKENELLNELNHLRGIIQVSIDHRNALRQNAAAKYGEGSFVTNAMDDFARDKAAQVKWMERQAELEQFCLDRELDYNKALREGNQVLEKRQKYLKYAKDGWKAIWGYTRKAADYWIAYNHQAVQDAKKLGITSRESAQAYNEALMESSKKLSRNFGMSRDQVMKMQETFVQTTGKAAILTQEQMSDIAAASSLMGEENVQAAISGMEQMGATSEQAMELMDRNYAKALNNGLNIAKASETLVKNLALANQFSFRDGVEGLMRMSIESQRVKLNVAEVAKVANKFSTIEGAIQGSAQLQMLGGAGAMFGGNPMAMMYESLADPEALYQRMVKMFSEQAYFDKSKGESIIDPLQLAIIKEQAKAMGIDENEAVTTTKQQAKLRAIREDWRAGRLSTFNNATDEERAAIENKAQYSKESGWTVTYVDRQGERQTKAVNDLDSAAMADIMKDNLEPVEDIRGQVRKIASSLVSMKDRWTGLKDMFWTSNAQFVNPGMKFIDNTLTDGAQGKGLAGTITDWASIPLVAFLGGLGWKGASWMGGKALGRVGDWILGRNVASASNASSSHNNGRNLSRQANGGITRGNYSKADVYRRWGGIKLGKVARTAGFGIGTALSIAQGAYTAYEGYQDAKKNYQDEQNYITKVSDSTLRKQLEINAQNKKSREQGGAIGAGAGVAVGGMAGAAIGQAVIPIPVVGGLIGAAVGGYLGEKFGKKFGKQLASENHSEDDDINKELDSIEKGDEEDNIKKIVLPIESIDYNVAMIAQMLGVSSASAARGNVYLKAAANNVVPEQIVYGNVAPVYEGGGNSNSSIGGNVNLKVDGAIELKLGGSNVGNIKPTDVVKMIQNDSLVRNEIIRLIVDENNRRGNGGKVYADGRNQRQGNIAVNY